MSNRKYLVDIKSWKKKRRTEKLTQSQKGAFDKFIFNKKNSSSSSREEVVIEKTLVSPEVHGIKDILGDDGQIIAKNTSSINEEKQDMTHIIDELNREESEKN